MDVNFAVIGTKFRSSVSIDLSLLVARLRKAVKTEDPDNIACGTMDLQLFLAKRANGDWLSAETELANAAIGERGRLKLDADGHLEVFEPMEPLQSLNDPKYFGANFESRAGQIHVLVVVPKKLWLVTASIENALETIGIRARVYEAAAEHVGFYDPALRSDGKDRAFWYEEDKSLRIHVLFDTKENARHLETTLRNCQMLICSPLKGRAVTTTVEEVFSVESQPLQRIFYEQYDPKETTSSQQSMVLSLSCSDLEAHLLDTSRAEFRYQRIEDERFFIPHSKAECCNLVPGKEWKEVMQYGKYDDDPNNRLALSREMHGYYDGLNCEVPLLTMYPGRVNEEQSLDGRYDVEVFVKVFDERCKDLVFSRLKAGATKTNDPLVMRTFVQVEDPQSFRKCMEWKHEETTEAWSSYLSMEAAVD